MDIRTNSPQNNEPVHLLQHSHYRARWHMNCRVVAVPVASQAFHVLLSVLTLVMSTATRACIICLSLSTCCLCYPHFRSLVSQFTDLKHKTTKHYGKLGPSYVDIFLELVCEVKDPVILDWMLRVELMPDQTLLTYSTQFPALLWN